MEAHDVTWYSHKPRFQEQVEAFMGNLLSMGMKRESVLEKGYDFALALQTDQQRKGDPVTATMMARAGELVFDALPGAYRLHDRHNYIR